MTNTPELSEPEKAWSLQIGPAVENPEHHIICYLGAIGLSAKQISKQLGLTDNEVKIFLDHKYIKKEISELQKELFGGDSKAKFQSVLPSTIEVMEEIMHDKLQKGSTRLTAANMLQERQLGKTRQEVDVNVSLIRELFEKLDNKDTIITVEASSSGEMKSLPLPESGEEAPAIEVQKENLDTVDQWIRDLEGKNETTISAN